MSRNKPPLFDLFIWLREQADLPLTIDQYHLLLRALAGGFGLTNRDRLKQICRLLWVKPQSSQADRFEQYFEQYFEQLPAEETRRRGDAETRGWGDGDEEDKEDKGDKETREIKEIGRWGDEGDEVVSGNVATSSSPTPQLTPTSSPTPQLTPIALRGELIKEQPNLSRRFSLRVQDFPLTRRQIQQNWRYLRLPIREGALTELDLEATVQQISQEGIFLEPILIPRRLNRTQLLLLIDNSSSMVPFRLLSEQLAATVKAGGFAKADIYYFRNCPRDYLYFYSNRPDNLSISYLLPQLHRNRTIVFIISDGGSARGGINRDRIQLTDQFLENLTPYIRHLVWLNPLPESRWRGTTAEAISQLVRMFELNSSGLKAAIRSIKC
ncbi:MAG: hypothetical protein F6K47_27295 [Symploca sp. SIO2E6]|nr:hypothetical protein [Symploca sp. SIO2E6]